ncbi:MAG: ribosomal protein S18-alanine N-acetyltransferase [Candidatus Bathyarchaeia archaeon]|nr:ribosomal protein S18-alanine N-acetyltransferase [Candidatus Bathyarchaeia archaeon]
MAKVTVEEASIKHLDRLYEIEMECFEKEAFTRQQIAYLLTDYDSVSLIARVDGEIVGFIIGKIYVSEKSAIGHILTIDVSPKHRRRGIGLKLLWNIERVFRCKGVKVCCLEVREDNVAALSLYQKFGYKKAGRLESYYGNAHGVYLKKVLT